MNADIVRHHKLARVFKQGEIHALVAGTDPNHFD
jgi:hypothetical protein